MNPAHFRLLHLVRYRFFLFAGSLPYILGAATAFYDAAIFNLHLFFVGFLALSLAFAGVEIFNEYFEPEDRVFYKGLAHQPRLSIWLGAGCFALALSIAVYLSFKSGALIIILAVMGFLIAYFYVGHPLRLIYKGLGEAAIFLAYGPLMVLGSHFLHSQKVTPAAVFASFIPGTLIFSLAILNEIVDYYHDLLAGKRNILFRIGKKKGAALFMIAHLFAYLLVIIGASLGILPRYSLLALIGLPAALKGVVSLGQHYDEPVKLIGTVNNTIFSYITVNGVLVISLIFASD